MQNSGYFVINSSIAAGKRDYSGVRGIASNIEE